VTEQYPVWQISYRGRIEPEVEELKGRFESVGVQVGSPREIKETDAKLGAEEIIITIIASAALKAVVQVAFDELKNYLTKKYLGGEKSKKKLPNIQIVVKKNGTDSGKRELLSLKSATTDTIKKFIDNLSETAGKAIDSLAGD
jgi:hypothetical protein